MANRKDKRPHENTGRENLIGSYKQNEKARDKAIELLPTGKLLEKTRELNGWAYMSKEKSSKQVHPNNIEKNLQDGWKLKNRTGF